LLDGGLDVRRFAGEACGLDGGRSHSLPNSDAFAGAA